MTGSRIAPSDRHRADQVDHFERVLRQDGDAIAGLYALAHKPCREPLDPAQIIAMANAPALEHERRAVGEKFRIAVVDIGERESVESHQSFQFACRITSLSPTNDEVGLGGLDDYSDYRTRLTWPSP